MDTCRTLKSKTNNEVTDNVQTEVGHEVRRLELKSQMWHFDKAIKWHIASFADDQTSLLFSVDLLDVIFKYFSFRRIKPYFIPVSVASGPLCLIPPKYAAWSPFRRSSLFNKYLKREIEWCHKLSLVRLAKWSSAKKAHRFCHVYQEKIVVKKLSCMWILWPGISSEVAISDRLVPKWHLDKSRECVL